MFSKLNIFFVKADFNSKSMFGKLNIYLVLKANFNSKFMFSKLNIQFTEYSVYQTLLYTEPLLSTDGIRGR